MARSEAPSTRTPSATSKAASNSNPEGLPEWRIWFDKLDPVVYWAFRAAALIGGMALLYLLYGIFGGGAGHLAANSPMLAQITQNMRIAAVLVHWSLIVIAVCLVHLMIDEKSVGPAITVLGVLLHFGAPFALSGIGASTATLAVAQVLRSTGFVLTVIGLAKSGLDVVRWIALLPSRMQQRADVGIATKAEPAQQRIAREANMFSPCWKLPYCREVIRKQCPAFLAKKRCWKFGRGCYCDEEMISRIIRGESIDTIQAPTRLSRQGKPPCGRCHIFLEHQALKYKWMSPMAVPATILVIYLVAPYYSTYFRIASRSLDTVWSRLAFASVDVSKMAPDAIKTTSTTQDYQFSQDIVITYAQNIFGVILGFFLLIYISKFIEWAIYKAKW